MNPYPKTTNKTTCTKLGQKQYVVKAYPMKRTKIKPVSKKQSAENAELKKLTDKLKSMCLYVQNLEGWYVSELGGYVVRDLEPHHIYGRLGKHMLSPFEIILVTREQHTSIHKHNNREQKMKLANLIHDKRVSQGFKEEDYK